MTADQAVEYGAHLPLIDAGGPPSSWLHITEDRGEAERMLSDVLAPMLNRPAEALRSAPL